MENNMNTVKRTSKRALKAGGYSLGLCAAAVVIVILLNLLVGELPGKYTKFDTSSVDYFSFSDETKAVVEAVKENVKLYLIAEYGQEDAIISEMLRRYAAMSDRIEYKQVDPTLQPNFVGQYTESKLGGNSVIVVSERRSSVADSSEFFVYSTEYGIINESELEYIRNYYAMYGQTFDASRVFYGEVLLTSAIDYVTAERIPKLYFLTSHGEAMLSESFLMHLGEENIETGDLKLVGAGVIPTDCAAIFINAPSTDITPDEASLLKDYLASGGNIMLTTFYSSYTAEKMPNLASLCEYMGMRAEDGVVADTDPDNYYRAVYHLLPNIGTGGFIDTVDFNVLISSAHGIKAVDGVDGISVMPLLKTSDKSFVRADVTDSTSWEKQDGDIPGPTYVGAISERALDGREETSKMIWFSSPTLTDDSLDSLSSHGNAAMFIKCASYLTDKRASVSMIAKEYLDTTLTMSYGNMITWAVVMAVVLPAAILISGFALWSRRRRR